MPELFSKPLSPEAKEKLTDFVEAYIETLVVVEVDKKADIAKKKAIDVLGTDIDILAFATTLMTIYKVGPFIIGVQQGKFTARKVAAMVVELAEKAREEDREWRIESM